MSSHIENEEQRESPSGFHFLDLYNNCQRKFFFKYVLGLKQKRVSEPLLFGSAFHEGKATFYQTADRDEALATVDRFTKSYVEKDLFENEEQQERVRHRTPILLDHWIDTYGNNDLKNYDIVAVESQLNVSVEGTNGFTFTARPDLIVFDKLDESYWGVDTKTSTFSRTATDLNFSNGDQVTAYWWAIEKSMDIHLEGYIADIAYWNKKSKGEYNIDLYRSDPVWRSERDIREFENELAGIMNEVSQKTMALETGEYAVSDLFRRNTHYCGAFFRPCEFIDICRGPIPEYAPSGFEIDERVHGLSDLVLDKSDNTIN